MWYKMVASIVSDKPCSMLLKCYASWCFGSNRIQGIQTVWLCQVSERDVIWN